MQTPPGYWGPPTASVDWCEQNYVHTHYVSELFNTLSSFVILAVGLCGLAWHWRVLERRFLLAFASLALVGIGSAAFHATLRFQLQMLDELPMLYTATLMVYLLLEQKAQPRFGAWLPLALGGYLVLATYGAAFTRGPTQFWSFQVSFALLEFFGLYRTYLIYRNSHSMSQRRLFRTGIGLYLGAIVLWYIDIEFCSAWTGLLSRLGLFNPQLHAWWHVLVGMGFYCLILVIAYERLQVLGQQPMLRYHALGPRLTRGLPIPRSGKPPGDGPALTAREKAQAGALGTTS